MGGQKLILCREDLLQSIDSTVYLHMRWYFKEKRIKLWPLFMRKELI